MPSRRKPFQTGSWARCFALCGRDRTRRSEGRAAAPAKPFIGASCGSRPPIRPACRPQGATPACPDIPAPGSPRAVSVTLNGDPFSGGLRVTAAYFITKSFLTNLHQPLLEKPSRGSSPSRWLRMRWPMSSRRRPRPVPERDHTSQPAQPGPTRTADAQAPNHHAHLPGRPHRAAGARAGRSTPPPDSLTRTACRARLGRHACHTAAVVWTSPVGPSWSHWPPPSASINHAPAGCIISPNDLPGTRRRQAASIVGWVIFTGPSDTFSSAILSKAGRISAGHFYRSDG